MPEYNGPNREADMRELHHFETEQENARLQAEVQRLRGIIEAAYGMQGWDIGSVKSILLPGLQGYEHLTPKPEKPEPLSSSDYLVRFGRGSSSDHWWVELVLMDKDSNDDLAVLALNDREGIQLSETLDERVREGRKDWS